MYFGLKMWMYSQCNNLFLKQQNQILNHSCNTTSSFKTYVNIVTNPKNMGPNKYCYGLFIVPYNFTYDRILLHMIILYQQNKECLN
jgi:hypothetical protein